MKINRIELLQKLQAVAPGLASRESIEQSSCFVFKGGRVITYNGEVACFQKSNLDLTGAVASGPLLALLDKLPEEDIDLTVGEGELLIKAGKGRRSGIRMEADAMLPIEDVEKPEGWRDMHEAFNEAVDIAAQCTSKDDSKGFYQTCVHIHPNHIEACDNYQFARFPVVTGVAKAALIKREFIKNIAASDMTQVCETKSWMHFRNAAGLRMSFRLYMDDFPDLDYLLDVKGKPATLPGGLADAVDKAAVFSSMNAENDNVMVELRADKMRLTGKSAQGWYKEQQPCKYSGPDINFIIAPKLLIEITKRTKECVISEGALKIDTGRWTYISCLGAPDEGPAEKTETTEE